MPKAKQYSIKRRSKGKKNKNKRGGGEHTDGLDDLDAMERGQKHGDYVIPIMMDPKDIRNASNVKSYQPQISSPEEVSKVFENRSARLAELDVLTEKYKKIREKQKLQEDKDKKKLEQEIQRLKDVKKMEEVNKNNLTLTSEEVSKVFDNQPKDCTNTTCVVSGGRISSRYRRNGHKSRKYRKR